MGRVPVDLLGGSPLIQPLVPCVLQRDLLLLSRTCSACTISGLMFSIRLPIEGRQLMIDILYVTPCGGEAIND